MKLQNIHAPWNPGFWRIQNLTFMASNIPIFRLLPVILIQLQKNAILFFQNVPAWCHRAFCILFSICLPSVPFLWQTHRGTWISLMAAIIFKCKKTAWRTAAELMHLIHGEAWHWHCAWHWGHSGEVLRFRDGHTSHDDPQLIPSGTWSSRDGFFFFGLENGKPQKSHCAFFWAKRILLGAERMKAKFFYWWCRNDGVFFWKNMSNGFLKSRSRIFWEILKHLAIQCRLEPLPKTGIFEMIPPDGLRISSKTDGESLFKSTSENCFHEGGHGELKCFMPSLTM